MLSDVKIIELLCIVDDFFKNMHHYEDRKVQVNGSEVITTVFISMPYFGGHLDNACHFVRLQGYVPNMFSKSRFCRRLHRLADFSLTLFYSISDFDVATKSCIYMDVGYTNYRSEEDMWEAEGIMAMMQRESSSKRLDEPHISLLKKHIRKEIETYYS